MGAAREEVRIGIVGAGAMGEGLLYQAAITPGVRCVAIADVAVDRALASAATAGRTARTVSTLEGVRRAVAAGELAVCEDGGLVAAAGEVDVLVESSSSIAPAARFALAAIESGKHLVLMNSEIDLAFGPYLMREAHARGVTYTSCDGDQHGVLKRLVDDLVLWGFAPVLIGNIKGFLDRYANPTTIAPEAERRRLSRTMCTAYTDGTKLNIEMALIANGLGLAVARPGMHGPRAERVQQVFDLLDVGALWRRHGAFVDYVLGAEPGGGVFAVGHCDHPYQRRMMAYYKMGDGPFYLFYRPYHLCHVESMRCVLDAARGRSLLEPTHGLRTNVFAYAKRGLAAGERLDGLGGTTCYGLIEACGPGGEHPGLPICLAGGVTVAAPIERDAPILMCDVRHDPEAAEFRLYRQAQEATRRLER